MQPVKFNLLIIIISTLLAGISAQYEWQCSALQSNNRYFLPNWDEDDVTLRIPSSATTIYIYPIPSVLNCNGMVSAIDYCYRTEETGQQLVFTLLTLVQNGLNFTITDVIEVRETLTRYSRLLGCDITSSSLNMMDYFQLPANNFAFGIVPASGVTLLRFNLFQSHYHVEQYQTDSMTIGALDVGTSFTLNEAINAPLRIFRFRLTPITTQPTTSTSVTERTTNTEMSISEAPTTEAPTTEAPTTEAPTTETPTEAPTTTTETPTTETPTTETSTTELPTTEAPTTEMSTTKLSTSEASTAKSSTTKASTTRASTTEMSTTEMSTTEMSTTEMSTTEVSTTEVSTTEDVSTTEYTTELTTEVTTRMTKTNESTTAPSAVRADNTSNVTGTAVGGAIGGILVMIIIIVFITVCVLVIKRRHLTWKPKDSNANGLSVTNAAYLASDDVIEIHDRQYASVNDYYAGIGPHVYSEVDNKISKKEHHCEMDSDPHEYSYACAGSDNFKTYYDIVRMSSLKEEQPMEKDIYMVPGTDVTTLYAQLEEIRADKLIRDSVRLGDLLGSGQFGMVYKGVLQSAGSEVEVAVKTLKEGSDKEDRVKFLQEAAIMGQFKHPNVVTMHGVVTEGEPILLVLELLRKGDLRDHLLHMRNEESVNVDEHTLLSYCRQVAAGMAYLSSKAFVHRDLAARNILLSENEICKIADFGMSRELMDESYYVSHGGKVPVKWTAPEALYYKKYSTASDVWSYGALLYEIWSVGHKPFENLTNAQVLKLIETGFRLSPPPGCPRALYTIMISCWHPVAAQRPDFLNIVQEISLPDTKLLKWSEEDKSVHPKAAKLGADLLCAQYLYNDLQMRYKVVTDAHELES